MNARIVGLAGIALGLAWATACSGQSGTEKDGEHPDRCPDFAIEPVVSAMAGDFAGGGLSLDVVTGEPVIDCVGSAYEVPLTLTLRAPDVEVDEQVPTEVAIRTPGEVFVDTSTPLEAATSTWRDPAMDGATELHYTWDLTFREPGWTVEIGWSGRSASGEVSGALGTWQVE